MRNDVVKREFECTMLRCVTDKPSEPSSKRFYLTNSTFDLCGCYSRGLFISRIVTRIIM